MSSASNYREELVTGPGGLSRGLLEEQAIKYGALPPTKRERSSLATILSSYVRNHFPDYAKLYSGAGVIGVPEIGELMSFKFTKPKLDLDGVEKSVRLIESMTAATTQPATMSPSETKLQELTLVAP